MFVRRVRNGVQRYGAFKCIGVRSRTLSSIDNLDHEERLDGCLLSLPSKAKVVICGGGVMGAAVAYHLSKRGWGDQTIVIEKEK